jgi:hypothetical protein
VLSRSVDYAYSAARLCARRLLPSGGQFFAVLGVCGWDIDIERPQWVLAHVAYFVRVASLDKNERLCYKLFSPTIYDRDSCPVEDVQPLIATPVPIVWAALCLAGGKYHHGSL